MLLGNFKVFGRFLIVFTLLALHREFGALGSITDEGICSEPYRRLKVRYVSSHQYPGRLTNYRYETFSSLEFRDVCCDGYEPLAKAVTLTCIPVCKSGCSFGKCHKPDVCICDLGYRESMDPSTGYITCLPDCPDGFVANETSCEPSCYDISSGGLYECGYHASCIAPNKCQCNDGYIAVTNASSSDDYDQTLIHNDKQTTDSTGWIRLEIINETTFNTIGVTCKPLCKSECGKNSTCIAPNDCQCNPGYSNVNNSLCLPECDKECVNGFCEYPNKCSCHPGYEPREFDDSICEPICTDECIYGICTLPDHCECYDGHEKLPVQAGLNESVWANVCSPVCTGQCLNGYCAAPGYCLCNSGYVLTLVYPNETMTEVADGIDNDVLISLLAQQSCKPLCNPNCPNGSVCTAPNQCQLRSDDYQDLNESSMNGTQNINYNHEYCGGNGILIDGNRTCDCHYGWTGTTCTKPSICAVIFTHDDNKIDENIDLQSVLVRNNGTVKMNFSINNGETNGNTNWKILKCKEECRNFILSSKNLNNDLINCQRVELSNATTNPLSYGTLPSEFFKENNKTVACFVNNESSCNMKNTKIVPDGRVGVIVEYFFLFVIAIGLGSVTIFFAHWKITRMRALRAVQRVNAMREQAEATESLYATHDSSYI